MASGASVVRGRRVLDFGAGCGASTIAALQNEAATVVVNDIDPGARAPTVTPQLR